MALLTVSTETWPIAGAFTISRGRKTEARVVVATLTEGAARGRGECVPYARYGESVDGVRDALLACREAVANGLDRAALHTLLPAGAARNALDCALWDLEARRSGVPVWRRAGLPAPRPLNTAFTLSLAPPEAMSRAARKARNMPLLKLKLGGDHADLDRVAAVAEAAPKARLILDANEAWSPETLVALAPRLAALRVVLIEQPLPAGADQALEGLSSPIPLCADESLHTCEDLDTVARRYGAVNIKLDKTGGLSEALRLAAGARELGLKIMVGCMVGTSLSMAPACLLGGLADFIDLDGPLLLARDRRPGLRYESGTVHPPPPDLWG